jgi:peptidoglycan/xylan/chitin deacetylase (PgdA/CDA1 family)
MVPKPQMTTSWDDGHPLDFRIAELLAKHGLRGTFYVPLENTRPTLSPAQIRDLAAGFEIGAHTVHHRVLTGLPPEQARQEIIESKRRIEEITGKQCPMFCFPSGRYARVHLGMAKAAGFSAARTVELLSLEPPRRKAGFSLIPTTVQAHPHSPFAYLRNAAKRFRVPALWNILRNIRGTDWAATAIGLLERVRETGGVFHLWGHSWEIEETGQWQALDRLLTAMAEAGRSASCVSNSELCGNDR